MNRRGIFVTLVACCLASASVLAADVAEPTAQATVDQLRSRLNLTAEQQAKIKPLAETRRTKLEATHAKLPDAKTRREKTELMREARQAQDEYVKAVTPILTMEQQVEWKKIRDESKQQLKERFREKKQ